MTHSSTWNNEFFVSIFAIAEVSKKEVHTLRYVLLVQLQKFISKHNFSDQVDIFRYGRVGS